MSEQQKGLNGFLIVLILFSFLSCGGSGSSDTNTTKDTTVISIAEIPGVVVPVRGAVPVITAIDTLQYTGTITWAPVDNPFAATTVYTANIVLTAKAERTLTGVAANFFKVAGATTVTNPVNSGVVTAVFAATGAISDIPVTFSGITQTGGTSGTVTTTALTLTFSVNPTSLSASNITVTGATKGSLSGTGTTRSLTISDITVANGSTVTVTVTSPAGFAITGSPQTVVIFKSLLEGTWSQTQFYKSSNGDDGTSGTADDEWDNVAVTYSGSSAIWTFDIGVGISRPTTSSFKFTWTTTYTTGNNVTTPADATKIDYTTVQMTATPLTAATVTAWNAGILYGFTDWTLNVEKDITGIGDMPSAGVIFYDVYKIGTGILYIGDDEIDSSYDGSTDLKRPVVFQDVLVAE